MSLRNPDSNHAVRRPSWSFCICRPDRDMFALALCVAVFIVSAQHRLPWIDEAWFAGPSVSLVRTGKIVDLGALAWTEVPQQAFSFEIFALLQAPVYALGGVDIFWGRMLSAACATTFLFILSRSLRRLGVSAIARVVAVVACGTNRYLLTAATQIRPEAAAMAATAASLLCLIRWNEKPERGALLATAHGLCIVAALIHLQAAFIGVSLWWVTLDPRRGLPRGRTLAAAFAPYALAAAGVGAYVGPRWSEFGQRLGVWFGGDMLGHSGGMFSAFKGYLERGQALKACAVIGLIAGAVGAWSLIARIGGRPARTAFLAYGAGAFTGWLLTTAHVDDYHASWLMFLYMPGVGCAIYGLAPGHARERRIVPTLLLLTVTLGLSGYGVADAIGTTVRDDRQLYFSELQEDAANFDPSKARFVGPRDVLWAFDFDVKRFAKRDRRDPPEYYFTYQGASGLQFYFEGALYRRSKIGRLFDLYRRQ